jgi:molybdate transport system substrate-binding protein
MWRALLKLFVAALLLFAPGLATADEIRIAVASNFADTLKEVALLFEEQTGHTISLSSGSTGSHYAMIINGAPFEAFFSADVERPRLLEEAGAIIPGSRFTYAMGRLVLWSSEDGMVDPEGHILERGDYKHLAIANPKLAPYGKAAREVLEARGLWDQVQHQLVRGESIGQTFQFVHTGNAQLGFVALSQLSRPGKGVQGSHWTVPRNLYSPIDQQAVLLKDNDTARAFLRFVNSDEIKQVIQGYGYDVR